MKVLLVHNEYGKRSGEEAVVDRMDAMLRGMGHAVARLTRSSAGARESLAGRVRAFVDGVHCPKGVKAMREALLREKPDVVNVHNLYPFISPAALRECRKAGVPVVMTVHNYRLLCPTGLFMRGGGPCELCLERGNEWGCVRYNCERSLPKSVAYAARNAVARIRRHYIDCVDVFACLTEFQRDKLIKGGYTPEKIVVIPNTVETGGKVPTGVGGAYVGYVGRLSREKGIDLIIEAARRNGHIPFKLAGSVADESLVADLPANMEYVGFKSGEELEDFFDNAKFMVMASRWYEGFPMSILEAGARRKCVIAPDHGGFSEIVSQKGHGAPIGRLFAPGDAVSLAAAVSELWDNQPEAERLGRAAFNAVCARYSSEAVAEMWQRLLLEII